MPDYGVAGADAGSGLLPWSWAQERLVQSHNYWLSTSRADGRPHVMPVWGVWLDDALYFSTAPGSRKARNIAERPECVVTTERADEAVIVEGAVSPENDAATLQSFKQAYDKKYDWDMETEGILVLRPRTVFGFIEHADQFKDTATRWRFDR
ncbi:MAG TPA: pyridoxamine 5'-phosphate oxidase family protein [Dehalococcoidia bacterium]|jgi:nitroimidazol reductase NimA-like FMN-containing flavoprotein (pyridoxamine 5'-phosphate oxidase superfamily)